MAKQRLHFALTLLSVTALAADERLIVTPGKPTEMRIALSAQDIASQPVLWVPSDPNRIDVTVVSPDGRRWTQATGLPGSPVTIQLADNKSGSEDEVSRVNVMGSNGT